MRPKTSFPALKVRLATALDPLAPRVPVPRVVEPDVKVIEPVGEVLPDAGFTVAVSTVLCVVEMLVGLAERLVVVPIVVTAPVRVTVVVAEAPLKAALPPYVAVTVLAPLDSELPAKVKVATPFEPDADKLEVPSVLLPIENVTVPVGEVVPVAGFTVAVKVVLAERPMLVGLALKVMVVLMLDGTLVHPVTRLFASTEPSPVTSSYPGPAL